jgi:hypothetical protein
MLLVGGVLFSRAPAAWAEVVGAAENARAGAAPIPPVKGEPGARKLRGLLLVHVGSIVAGYAAYALAWAASCVALLAMLFTDAARLLRVTVRTTTVLTAVGVALMLVGILLGCVWAEANLGRYWGWDVREINGVLTLLAGVVWLAGSVRQWRSPLQSVPARLEPGMVAAACFWFAMSGWWWIAFVGGGDFLLQSGLCLGMCILGNVALLAGAWWAQRRLATAEG